jgi:hypothetical protein
VARNAGTNAHAKRKQAKTAPCLKRNRAGELPATDRHRSFWESNLRRSANNAGSEPPQPEGLGLPDGCRNFRTVLVSR